MVLAYFLPSEAHSKEEEASDVLSSDRAQTETDDMLPARKGHIQILLDSQLPLYEQYRLQLNQAGKENIYVCLSGGPYLSSAGEATLQSRTDMSEGLL